MNHLAHILFLALLGISTSWGETPPLTDDNNKRAPEIYSPIGKRDPFRSPVGAGQITRGLDSLLPLERYNIEQLQLRGIIRGFGEPRAMFEDPEGQVHIIKQGEFIGRERGTLSRVLKSDVIITERTFNYLGEEELYERVISLPKE